VNPAAADSAALGAAMGAAMGEALAQARRCAESDDVPVGALVIDADGTVLGRGHNQREATQDPTAHAEILALRAAGSRVGSWQLPGTTLVVTLEPCPMCAGAAVLARVARVVFGAWDPKAGAAGSVWDLLRDRRLNHRPEVISGVREDECAALLAEFFASRR
jgi:tRNA(adenine34) deaminase